MQALQYKGFQKTFLIRIEAQDLRKLGNEGTVEMLSQEERRLHREWF